MFAFALYCLGTAYLLWQISRSKKKGEGFEEELVPSTYQNMERKEEESKEKNPNIILSFLPMVLLIGIFILLENVKFGDYSFKSQTNGMASVCTAIFIVTVVIPILATVVVATLATVGFVW